MRHNAGCPMRGRVFPYVPWLDKGNIDYEIARFASYGINLTEQDASAYIFGWYEEVEKIAWRKVLRDWHARVKSCNCA